MSSPEAACTHGDSNHHASTKEFAPKAQAALKNAGGRFLAAGQKVMALEGEPSKTRSLSKSGTASKKCKLPMTQSNTRKPARSATSRLNSARSPSRVYPNKRNGH